MGPRAGLDALVTRIPIPAGTRTPDHPARSYLRNISTWIVSASHCDEVKHSVKSMEIRSVSISLPCITV
jgi:hypothetical protein